MAEHDEPKEEQPVEESEKDQSSTKAMSAAGKIRVEEMKFAAKQRVEAKLDQNTTDGDDPSDE